MRPIIRFFERLSYDLPLMVGLFLMLAISLLVLYSASGGESTVLMRQVIRYGFAFGVMMLIAQLRPTFLHNVTPYLYTFGLVLLVAVLAVGIVGKGAQRWLDLGFMRFQPSEILKLAVPLMVAWVASKRNLPINFGMVVACFCVMAAPAALIGVQPDLGTALLVSFAGLVVIFVAGISWRIIATLAVIVSVSAPMAWQFVLHDYQKQRILTLFDPWSDPRGDGYHTIQSIIAIGSGGSTGKGWLEGTQSHLEFIPERTTDFIFSVFGEEFGFWGSAGLLSVYLFITFRGIMIAFYAQAVFDRLVAASITMTFMFYVFVNIGMVSGILPVVGVPLPLVSYGGTSIVTLMAGFGILMSIQSRQRKLMGS